MAAQPKVVLVTGCSKGGIGFNLCEEFAAKGCIVYATSRKIESMEGFKHSGIRRLALDVSSDEDVQNAVDTIIDAEGRIDILVNNAGVICIGPVVEVPLEQTKETFDINVYGPLRAAHAVIPRMAQRKQGVIVNIGSIVGELPTPWNGIYSATKAALQSISEVLWMECKPFNIHVTHVSAGSVKSNLSQNHAKVFNLPADSLYKKYIDHMVRRMHISQSGGTLPTSDFARKVVSKTLNKRPPRYMTLGGNSTLCMFLKWLPKGLVLSLLWWMFSKG